MSIDPGTSLCSAFPGPDIRTAGEHPIANEVRPTETFPVQFFVPLVQNIAKAIAADVAVRITVSPLPQEVEIVQRGARIAATATSCYGLDIDEVLFRQTE